MATVKEIAEKCGVSIGTVDRVLHNRGRVNAETRRRVLEAAEQLQYVPNRAAQSLAVRKRKLHLGFIAQCQKGHPFFDDINRAAQKKAEELKEFGVTVTFLYNDVYVSEDGFLKSRLNIPEGFSLDSLDGLVSPGITTAMYRPDGSRRSFPVAYYNIAPENHNELLSVSCDYFKSGTIAAGLCALTGGDHATIAIITEGVVSDDIYADSAVTTIAPENLVYDPVPWKELGISAGVFTFSSLFVDVQPFKRFRYWVHDQVSHKGKDRTEVDNYLQYVPAAAPLLLYACGYKGDHNFLDKTILLAMSAATFAVLNNVAKYAFNEKRPDSNAHNSFPSGHTALW